jgi:hypothetical protein
VHQTLQENNTRTKRHVNIGIIYNIMSFCKFDFHEMKFPPHFEIIYFFIDDLGFEGKIMKMKFMIFPIDQSRGFFFLVAEKGRIFLLVMEIDESDDRELGNVRSIGKNLFGFFGAFFK